MSFEDYADEVERALRGNPEWTEDLHVGNYLSRRIRKLVQAYREGRSVPEAANLMQLDRANEQRLDSVREAYWRHTPEEHDDRSELRDVLIALGIVEEPTVDQIKAFCMILPAYIIGEAMSWGFSDAEVRERTHEFVRQNEQAVFTAIRQSGAECAPS